MKKQYLTAKTNRRQIVLWLWLMITLTSAISNAQVSEVIKKFNDKTLRFYSGFNQKTLDAEFACGQASPLKLEGEPIFKKGVFGSALFLQKGIVSYKSLENMPTGNESGTICFWYYPIDWDLSSDKQPNNIFFRSQYPYSGLIHVGLKKLDGKVTCLPRLAYYIHREIDAKKKDDGLSITDPFKNKQWLFIALCWNKSKVTLSINANSPGHSGLDKTHNFLKPMENEETLPDKKEKAEFSFSMPSPGMVDEVMVFNRNLSGEELLEIYQLGIKDIGQ